MRRRKQTIKAHLGSDERILCGMLRFLALVSLIFAGIFLTGVLLLARFEHLRLFEAFYLAVITVTTVGYGDYYPASEPGKLVALVLAVTGVGYQWLSLSTVVVTLVEGHIIRFSLAAHGLPWPPSNPWPLILSPASLSAAIPSIS